MRTSKTIPTQFCLRGRVWSAVPLLEFRLSENEFGHCIQDLCFIRLPQSKIKKRPRRRKSKIVSFDNLVRPYQYIRRHRQTNLLCDFQVEHQVKLVRRLDPQFTGLGALESLVAIGSST